MKFTSFSLAKDLQMVFLFFYIFSLIMEIHPSDRTEYIKQKYSHQLEHGAAYFSEAHDPISSVSRGSCLTTLNFVFIGFMKFVFTLHWIEIQPPEQNIVHEEKYNRPIGHTSKNCKLFSYQNSYKTFLQNIEYRVDVQSLYNTQRSKSRMNSQEQGSLQRNEVDQ